MVLFFSVNYLKHQTSINQDWDDFREWWETFSETDVLELVIYGIQENMAYYEKYLPSDPSVDEKLQEISLESEQLKFFPIGKKQFQSYWKAGR